MKNVITTVGTSIFINYAKKKNDIKSHYKDMKNKSYKEWNNYEGERKSVKKSVLDWANGNLETASAETKSLIKISKKYNDALNVYFLTTDTVLSNLAAEIIKEILKESHNKWTININHIEGLDAFSSDGRMINKGYQNLIKYSVGIAYYDFIFNISGGYKAIVPVMAMIASVKHCEMCYIYEESEYLVQIPPFPMNYDVKQCNDFKDLFAKMDDDFINLKDYKKYTNQLSPEDKIKISSFIKIEDDENAVWFTEFGYIIWEEWKKTGDIELIECNIKPENKKIKLSDHHGIVVLSNFSKKLVNCKYVCEIINSLDFEPKSKKFIRAIKDKGIIEITLMWEDAGYGLVMETTGRNKRETEKIAKIIKEKYCK